MLHMATHDEPSTFEQEWAAVHAQLKVCYSVCWMSMRFAVAMAAGATTRLTMWG